MISVPYKLMLIVLHSTDQNQYMPYFYDILNGFTFARERNSLSCKHLITSIFFPLFHFISLHYRIFHC